MEKGTYYFVMYNSYYSTDEPYEFSLSVKSPSLKSTQVKVSNNKGISDSVTVSNLTKGDNVKVYTKASKGTLFQTVTAKGATASLSLKQLGTKAGKIYVTVTNDGKAESDRIAITFKGEQSDSFSK